MMYEKGQKFLVKHKRKGEFYAIAQDDFDTGDEWYPLADFYDGENLAVRRALCEITPIENIR